MAKNTGKKWYISTCFTSFTSFKFHLQVVFPPPNSTGDTPSARVRDPEISPCAVAICVGAAVAANELAVGNTAKAKMQPKGGRKAWKRRWEMTAKIGLEKT